MADQEQTQPAGQTGTISIEQAARLLMISAERVRQLASGGYIQRAGVGRYPLVGVVQGYIRFLKDEERRTAKSASASRLQEAKADEVKIRIAERHRELIPIEDAEAVLDFNLAAVSAELTGLPARITRDLSLRRQIEQEVNDALARLADAHGAAVKAARSGRDISEAAADPDARSVGEGEPQISEDGRSSGPARPGPDALRDPDRKGRRKRAV